MVLGLSNRRITPSQLSLFSISPVIGAWWEELQAQKLFDGSKPAVNELDQQLFADGLRHEQALLNKLDKAGHSITRLPGKQTESDYSATREAMAEGVEFIHQASLCNEEMRGSADLLKRIDRSSLLGEWSYIPIECKLASKPKTTFLVQALAYGELLTPLLGHRPDQFWAWSQGMRQSQRQKLRAEGISTIEALAALPAATVIPGLSAEALHELRQQAELQLRPADAEGRPAYRLRPVVPGQGLAALPAADPGDIWFDMEGIQDSVAGTKVEYLFGACYRDTPEGHARFMAWWAHSPAEEKAAFEGWVGGVVGLLRPQGQGRAEPSRADRRRRGDRRGAMGGHGPEAQRPHRRRHPSLPL